MFKRLITFTILIFISSYVIAQKRLSFDLNAAILQSVGKDKMKTYTSTINPLTVYYFSRKKFKHPYFNLLTHVSYSLNPTFSIGLQTGVYMHYLEKYFSNIERTTFSIPVMATARTKLFKVNSNEIGIDMAAGGIFYSIDEIQNKIKNGTLYDISVFYSMDKKSTLKLGVEKQVDNVSFYFTADEPGLKNETYNYNLNRLSIMLCFKYEF